MSALFELVAPNASFLEGDVETAVLTCCFQVCC